MAQTSTQFIASARSVCAAALERIKRPVKDRIQDFESREGFFFAWDADTESFVRLVQELCRQREEDIREIDRLTGENLRLKQENAQLDETSVCEVNAA